METARPITNVYPASDKAFFVKLLEHDDFLEKYEHFLRGEVLVEQRGEGGKFLNEAWVKRYPPKMNNFGINEVMSFLRPICESKIMAITEFDEEFIDKLILTNIQSFTELLVENFTAFELRSISGLDSVVVQGINIISAQLRRSYKGTTLDAFTSNTTITEQRAIPVQEQKRSLLSRVPFFGKKEPTMRI